MANDDNKLKGEAEAKRKGFVNVHGEPRVKPVNHDGDSVGLGDDPAPKYEVPADEREARDPLTGAIPGSDLAAAIGQPESPHLGGDYIPGSSNTNEEHSRFEGAPTGPPKRVKQ